MNTTSNNNLSNEILDNDPDKKEATRLELVKTFVKDNIFYIIAGTSLITGFGDHLYVTHYREFDPQPYLNGGEDAVFIREIYIGFSLFLLRTFPLILSSDIKSDETKDISKQFNFVFLFYVCAITFSFLYVIRNKSLFNEGFNDGNNIELIDQERMDNIYYRGGVTARQNGLERIR